MPFLFKKKKKEIQLEWRKKNSLSETFIKIIQKLTWLKQNFFEQYESWALSKTISNDLHFLLLFLNCISSRKFFWTKKT